MMPLQREKTVEQLLHLIENFDRLRDASELLQQEGVEWYEADKTYIDSLKSWMNIVGSVLASSGRLSYVEDWRNASSFEITVVNVHDFGQRIRTLLDTFRNVIESETDGENAAVSTKYNVFLSHSSEDEEKAGIFYDEIIKAGGKAFLDKKSLQPGDDFAERIRLAILASQELWLLISPAALKSEWVMSECGAAWILNNRIVPVLLNCRPEDLPDRLRRLQCIDFDKHNDLIEKGFDSAL